jgi:hypothetical protein
MVLAKSVDNATEIITDPRFGPPAGSSLFEGSSPKSDWTFFMLILGLVLIVSLIVAPFERNRSSH